MFRRFVKNCSERFVPITRMSIIRHLMQEKNFLNPQELKKFEDFALALDAAIVNRHHDLLQELKVKKNTDSDTFCW